MSVPTPNPIVAAGVSGLFALLSAAIGAFLVAAFTLHREDRARRIQHVREVAIGALDAQRALASAMDEYREANQAMEKKDERLEKVVDITVSQTELLKRKVNNPGIGDDEKEKLEAQNAELAKKVEGYYQTMNDRLDELGKVSKVLNDARSGIEHWASVLEITCTPVIGKIYRHLCGTTDPDERRRQRDLFAAAVREELAQFELGATILRLFGCPPHRRIQLEPEVSASGEESTRPSDAHP